MQFDLVQNNGATLEAQLRSGERDFAILARPLATTRDEPLLSFKPGHAIRAVTDQLCADAGFTPNVVFAADKSRVIRGFVKAGFGIALVPESMVRDGLVTFRVRDPKPIRRIGIAWLRDHYAGVRNARSSGGFPTV